MKVEVRTDSMRLLPEHDADREILRRLMDHYHVTGSTEYPCRPISVSLQLRLREFGATVTQTVEHRKDSEDANRLASIESCLEGIWICEDHGVKAPYREALSVIQRIIDGEEITSDGDPDV